MTPTFVLARSAIADLRGIASYTKQQWGIEQAEKYRNQLMACAEMIALSKGQFRDLSHLRPGLRVARCQHHYIFCLPREGRLPLIVAIFHERMDLMARLSTRLG